MQQIASEGPEGFGERCNTPVTVLAKRLSRWGAYSAPDSAFLCKDTDSTFGRCREKLDYEHQLLELFASTLNENDSFGNIPRYAYCLVSSPFDNCGSSISSDTGLAILTFNCGCVLIVDLPQNLSHGITLKGFYFHHAIFQKLISQSWTFGLGMNGGADC